MLVFVEGTGCQEEVWRKILLYVLPLLSIWNEGNITSSKTDFNGGGAQKLVGVTGSPGSTSTSPQLGPIQQRHEVFMCPSIGNNYVTLRASKISYREGSRQLTAISLLRGVACVSELEDIPSEKLRPKNVLKGHSNSISAKRFFFSN